MRASEVEEYMERMQLDHEQVVHDIRQGDWIATEAFRLLLDNDCRVGLVDAGVVDVLLDLLRPCGTHTLEDVLPNRKTYSLLPSLPYTWIVCLMNTVCDGALPSSLTQETSEQVWHSIEPLAQCMSDPRKLLFGSHAMWLESVVPYTELLVNLSSCSSIVTHMADHPAIPQFVVHVLCLRVYQSEIVDAMNLDDNLLLDLEHSAAIVLLKMTRCERSDDFFATRNVQRLCAMAQLDVGSNSLSSDADVEKQETLAECLVKLISIQPQQHTKEFLFYVLYQLIAVVSVPFEVVHPNLISMGMQTDVSQEDACNILMCTACLLSPSLADRSSSSDSPSYTSVPSDEKFAASIRAGMFELCFKLQAQFGHHSDWEGTRHVNCLLTGSGTAAISRFTSKVIARHEVAIEEMVESYAASSRCDEQIKLIRAVIRKVNAANSGARPEDRTDCCRWCHTSVCANAVKTCGSCNRAVYCSRECQGKHWKRSHREDCKFLSMLSRQNGLSPKDIKSAKRHEQNLSSAGQRIFWDNVTKILFQATLLRCSILDCVVVLNFVETPVVIDVAPSAEYLENCDHGNADNLAHTKLIFERNRKNKVLTVACVSTCSFGTSILMKAMSAAAGSATWEDQQEETNRFLYSMGVLSAPEERERLLQEVMKDGPFDVCESL